MPPARIMLTYWGRRGPISQLTFQIATAAMADRRVDATVSVSRQNERFLDFEKLGCPLFTVDTFMSDAGALLQASRIPLIRRRLYQRLTRDRIQAVIELMPHIWSPMVMSVVRKTGARYCTIVHDADRHPGDRTSWAKWLTDRSLSSADLVLTLSSAVADRLIKSGRLSNSKIITLFHPDLTYGPTYKKEPPPPGLPWRLLFLGRIMPYKGLPLFLDTIDQLRRDGIAVEVGVFGEGSLGSNAERLQQMGAEVVNRWLSSNEISDAFARYHAIVLSHTEASQSGVAAAAFGAGVPVVATPVGGLREQVIDGVTGAVSSRTDARSLAIAVKRLFDPAVYQITCARLMESAEQRSIGHFLTSSVSCALHGKSDSQCDTMIR